MELVQEDTVRLVRDIVVQKAPTLTTASPSSGACNQSDFVSAEGTRARLGEQPQRVREAEQEMLRQLREM
jgi:hypothetical protein